MRGVRKRATGVVPKVRTTKLYEALRTDAKLELPAPLPLSARLSLSAAEAPTADVIFFVQYIFLEMVATGSNASASVCVS